MGRGGWWPVRAACEGSGRAPPRMVPVQSRAAGATRCTADALADVPAHRSQTVDVDGIISAGAGQNAVVANKAGVGGDFLRVRGAGQVPEAVHRGRGTIPAGAGSSDRRAPGRRRRGDHPRGCGEQRDSRASSTTGRGPSPRVRGAGPWERASHRRRDHPRGCGEQASSPIWLNTSRGPSPRVRGAGVLPDLVEHQQGTIPAGAGSSPSSKTPPSPSGDHPRGCG